MQTELITRTVFNKIDNNGLAPCPVCATPQFEAHIFPGTDDICGICNWHDDTGQYEDPNLEESSNDVSLNQARENYQYYGTTDLIRLERIRESITESLIYGLKLEDKKSSAEGMTLGRSLWYYLENIISELFYPRFSYDDMDKVKTRIGKFYSEEEAIALNNFAINFRKFMERIGLKQEDEIYIGDQEWQILQKQAAALVELMKPNNHKYHFEYSYISHKDILTKIQ